VDATVQFENGIIGSLRGSRISQQRVRDLTVTAPECQINVDYLDQSIQIYRHSTPEYVTNDGDVRYRNESVIEQPIVDNGEPLKAELEAFLGAVRSRDVPPVTIEDGVRAIAAAEWIEADSSDSVSTVSPDLTI
jgi:predicted dehydrogenase